jgi:hypothetical protein
MFSSPLCSSTGVLSVAELFVTVFTCPFDTSTEGFCSSAEHDVSKTHVVNREIVKTTI